MSEIKEIQDAIKACKEEIKFYKNELKEPYMKEYLTPHEDYCKGQSETYCKMQSQIRTFEFIISALQEKQQRDPLIHEVVKMLERYEEEWRTGYGINFGVNDVPADETDYWELKNLLDRLKEVKP